MQRKAQSEQFSAASLADESRSFWVCHPTLYSCSSMAWTAPENKPQAGVEGWAGFLPSVQ